MQYQKLLGGVLVPGLTLVGSAHAALFTFTTTGVIDSGHNSAGVFGEGLSSLRGLGYQLTMTTDYALNVYLHTDSAQNYAQSYGGSAFGLAAASVTVSATVNGYTATSHLPAPYINHEFIQGSSATNPGFNKVFGDAYSLDENGHLWRVYAYLYSDEHAFLATTRLDQGLYYAALTGDVGETFFDMGGGTFFSGRPTSIALSGAASVVEPASFSLLVLGLVGCWLRRRRFVLSA